MRKRKNNKFGIIWKRVVKYKDRMSLEMGHGSCAWGRDTYINKVADSRIRRTCYKRN